MIAALDLYAAREGIGRDIDELLSAGWFGRIVVVVVFGLPAASFLALLTGRWLALLPFGLSLALGSLWIASYATDWIGPQSGPGGLWLGLFFVLGGWTWLGVAFRWPKRTRPD